ncbi:MAG TPA: sulfite exporter TauE/SafE family protein [Rickettsiales bacterium]|nr:sulfite exporter TauE/SafE family protein [Rickettsiales bacterium]
MEHCHEMLIEAGPYGLAATLFMAALLGSISHCAGMCGPFVLAQVSGFAVPPTTTAQKYYRLLLLPYHAGRMTTYTFLGVLACTLTAPLLHAPALKILSAILLVAAGILFLASAFSQLFPTKYFQFKFNLCGAPHWIMQRINLILPSHTLAAGYVLGVLLGFLPCGLVYAAVLAAAATGNVTQAAVGMMAFAVGTVPMLTVIALGGKMLVNRNYAWIKPVSAVLMAGNSVALFAMAGKGFV